jgi:hypothetical protein
VKNIFYFFIFFSFILKYCLKNIKFFLYLMKY